jgi:hypothetical protein
MCTMSRLESTALNSPSNPALICCDVSGQVVAAEPRCVTASDVVALFVRGDG